MIINDMDIIHRHRNWRAGGYTPNILLYYTKEYTIVSYLFVLKNKSHDSDKHF